LKLTRREAIKLTIAGTLGALVSASLLNIRREIVPQVFRISAGLFGLRDPKQVIQVTPFPGEVIVSCSNPVAEFPTSLARINLERMALVWKEEMRGTSGSDYRPDAERIVGMSLNPGVANEIREWDAKRGAALRRVTAYNIGAIGLGELDVVYDRDDPNYVWVADYSNHIAGRLNLNTGVLSHTSAFMAWPEAI
jgi:hypothetical protein